MSAQDWWNAKGRRYFKKGDFRDRPFEFAAMAERVGAGPVLEVGSAFGMFSKYLPDSVAYLGVDLSGFMVYHARRLFAHRLFVHGDLWQMRPVLEGAFDTVIAMQFVEHFADPCVAAFRLKTFARRRLLLNVPRGPTSWQTRANDGHLSEWLTDEDFVETLRQVGDVKLFRGARNHICAEVTW